MTPEAVIESYVADVARQLPMNRRGDVAAELQALLTESLADRAGGAKPNAAMAEQLVREFGRPTEAAARYQPPAALIDPADTRNFIVTTVIGWLILASVRGGEAKSLGLRWLVAVLVFFAVRGWILRTRPDSFPWKPRRVVDPDRASRLGQGLVVIAIAVSAWLLLDPAGVIEIASAGRLNGADFVYDAPFRAWRLPAILVLLAALAAIELVSAARGRWTGLLRSAEILLLAALAVQANWRGDAYLARVFVEPASNQLAALSMQSLAATLWLVVGIKTYVELGRIPPPGHSPRRAVAGGLPQLSP